jgi:uncharacterized protein
MTSEYTGPPEPDLVARAGGPTHETRVARFLEYACWDHHTHGKGDHRMYDRAAQRILAHHPEIARDSLYTAIVCGDLEEVARRLGERPEAAREIGGPRDWTPILYLAFTRFTFQPTLDHALDIARLLLDRGANPNDFYMAYNARYSVLTGIAGEGEQDAPRQPYAAPLFQLMLERGAEPFDIQVLYDTHFRGDIQWWLELVHAHTMTTDRRAAWDDPEWPMLDMGGYGSGARFILETALEKNDLPLMEWALARGANPNAASAKDPRFPKRSLYEEAIREGLTEMADLLARYGAVRRPPVLNDEEQFLDACFRLDHAAVRAHVERHAEHLGSPQAMFAAAKRDRADVIALLLDLGVPIDIADRHNVRALHHAAGTGARRAAALLVERGAEIDPRESIHDNTPIGWAAHFDDIAMLDFLSQYSRDVWHLTFCGYPDRLREVLRAEPDLAKQAGDDGTTPLWWLPDDEDKAIAIVDMLIAAGADPAMKSRGGRIAMDWALQRGMVDVARRLAAAERS